MQLKMTFKQINDGFRKAIDKHLKEKNMENDAVKNTLKKIMINFIAEDFAILQDAIDNDNKCDIKKPIKDIYFETLCANYIFYKHDFDAILESAIKKTNNMHDFIMSLDKREHIRSIIKLLAEIDNDGLTERNIAIIMITIRMISLQYDIDFGECVADIKVEDVI